MADVSEGSLSRLASIVSNNYIAIASFFSVGFGLFLIRQLVSGGRCRSKARLDGKFVIITGANTGIGKETAKELALRGARVLIASRDPLKGAAAADDIFNSSGQRMEVKTLDLADLNSVRSFARDINEVYPRLDILINNAGVMACPTRVLTRQGFELHLGTNHLGHFLLTNLLKDLLVRTPHSRVVVVSALMYRWGKINFDDLNSATSYSPMAAYAQSKLANILFTRELARKLKGTGVTVNCLHPGVINTELGRHIEDRVPNLLRFLLLPLSYLMKTFLFKTANQGAQTTIHCAVSEELEGVTGKYFSDCSETNLLPNAKDDEAARRLWSISEEMTGLLSAHPVVRREKISEDQLDQGQVDKSKPASVIQTPHGTHLPKAAGTEVLKGSQDPKTLLEGTHNLNPELKSKQEWNPVVKRTKQNQRPELKGKLDPNPVLEGTKGLRLQSKQDTKQLLEGTQNPKPELKGKQDLRTNLEGTQHLRPALKTKQDTKPVLEDTQNPKPVLEDTQTPKPVLRSKQDTKPVLDGTQNPKQVLKDKQEGIRDKKPLLTSKQDTRPLLEGAQNPKPELKETQSPEPLLTGSQDSKIMLEKTQGPKPLLKGTHVKMDTSQEPPHASKTSGADKQVPDYSDGVMLQKSPVLKKTDFFETSVRKEHNVRNRDSANRRSKNESSESSASSGSKQTIV